MLAELRFGLGFSSFRRRMATKIFANIKFKLLKELIWKYTEADGKLNTRHRSLGASACEIRSQLVHEHVFTRSSLAEELMQAAPDDVDSILAIAIGCIVTKDEHKKLYEVGLNFVGWERYEQAGVPYAG